ncbi:MAG: 50S ribosomal protein L22 [Paenibacillaceae bacterium ZCTH02-B3]|mgnify:CR=1 FL=1|nr:MAG: 50S ribosomal protein L22 [Paenibacillaceae bacterium ZCTH02-B3]
MAQARAIARYVRIAPRKVRLVCDLIRGKDVAEAIAILRHTPRAASPVLEKLLNSAVANAEHNYQMDVSRLYISEIYANEGPRLKRYQPRARGMAFPILKRTSHITLVVSERPERSERSERSERAATASE